MKKYLLASIICWMIALTLFCFIISCGDSGLDYAGANVIYSGEPYGDFITLFNEVESCMGFTGTKMPHITLTDTHFKFYDEWCGGLFQPPNSITMIAPTASISRDTNNLIDTEGALWSHELTHYLNYQHGGDWKKQDSPCGTLRLKGFNY